MTSATTTYPRKGRKERQMASSTITPTTGLHGALDGFKTTCEVCGMVLSHTFESSLQLDALAHAAYHERAGK